LEAAILMFQQKSARACVGSSSMAARSIWLTLRSGSRRSFGAVMVLSRMPLRPLPLR
jgi:hypothetical protein